jgi:hypothetical protein
MKSLFSRFRSKDREGAPAQDTKAAGLSRRPSSETIQPVPAPSALRLQPSNRPAQPTAPSPAPSLAPSSRSATPSGLPGCLERAPSIPRRTSSIGPTYVSRPSSTLSFTNTKKGDHAYVGADVERERETVRTLSATYLDVSGHGGTKKVTFRSPIPTPPSSALMDGLSQPDQPSPAAASQNSSSRADRSTARKHSLPPLSSIRPIHPSSSGSTSRASSSPSHPLGADLASPAPSTSASMTSETSLATSTQSYLAQANSWSEMAEEDLIANLGPKERTRQEVLWEIVSSEERWVFS